MSAVVTDHAVVRYLERAWGVNVAALRARIARQARPKWPGAEEIGDHNTLADGLRYHFRVDGDGTLTLITVTTTSSDGGSISKRGRRLQRRYK